LEGAYHLSTGKLLSLSEQQLVDCAYLNYGNLGCNGGLMDNAFTYVKATPIELEADYGYTGTKNSCSYSAAKGQF
jgi:hypothetical protein